MSAIVNRRRDKRIIAAAGDIQPAALTGDQYCQRWQIGRNTLRRLEKAGLVTVYRFGVKGRRYADAPPRSPEQG